MKQPYVMNYNFARERIKTLNRSIGQLERYWLWNLDKIEEAKKEKRELEKELPKLKEEHEWFWSI